MSKLLLFLFTSFGFSAFCAVHEIKMLNKGSDGEKMVFEPAFLKANVGDTIKFLPVDKGHMVEGLKNPGALPAGIKAWKGGLNKEVTVVLEKEGVYLYKCMPHMAMGMVGLVVAGKASNFDAAQKVKFTGKAKMRMDDYLKKAEALK